MCKDSVLDIKFAPRHIGLVLAVAVSNGNVLIFEARDPLNLTTFTETCVINTMSPGSNSISWNPAFDESPMIIVGCQKYGQS